MYKHVTTLFLSALLPLSVSAQVYNGSFEDQLNRPQGHNNVAGAGAQFNDLPFWSGVSGTADYLGYNAVVSDMAPLQNPLYGPFAPQDYNSCVALTRSANSYAADQFITQQGTFIPGHRYYGIFHVLRRPGPQIAERMAMYITDTAPTYTSPVLSPAPYASIVSDPIADDQQWTQVVGSFVARASTAYVTLGFDRTLGSVDASLSTTSAGTGREYYAIDNVFFLDYGCETPEMPEIAIDHNGDCQDNSQYFKITNYNSQFTYHIVVNSFGSNALPAYLGHSYTNSSGVVVTPANRSTFRIKGGAGITGATFSVTATNNCDGGQFSTTASELDASYPDCSFLSGRESYSLYPNPATDEVLIQASREGSERSQNAAPTTIQVHDSYGKLRLEQTGAGASTMRLRTHKLPAGLYFLTILHGKEVMSRQQLQIE